MYGSVLYLISVDSNLDRWALIEHNVGSIYYLQSIFEKVETPCSLYNPLNVLVGIHDHHQLLKKK